ncbi:MAG TPA: carboxypeptidase regulatory-like domain-containing protein [Gemmatimonas sp.]|uniref:carboxypeptidase regulatory-like domain-containing protein n=1 Tax=Gemmatimonas sp. TaxID=1962908 RepID=UPI002ED98A3D
MHKALARFALSLIGSTLLWSTTAVAQPVRALGTVRGMVFDSLTRRPLTDAVVEVQETARLAYTDKQGRFALDSVPIGVQQLSFSSPTLDSLGVYGFAREIDVTADTRGVVLSTPSFRTMYDRLCPAADNAPRDSAIVFGTVYDAATRVPISKASVTLRWYETGGDGRDFLILTPERSTFTADDGVYGICGVPSDLALSTSAAHDSATSGTFSTVVGTSRLLRRDLYVSRELTSAVAADTSARAPRGTGVVRGTVRDESGNALVGALVVLTTVDRTTHTDSLGRYRFANVPLGTQELSVRQLGRGALYRVIDVTGVEGSTHDFVLPVATVLATMNVRGSARVGVDQAGFLRRKRQGFARIVEREEIQKRYDIGAALDRIPGLRTVRSLGTIEVVGSRPDCAGPMNVVIDGVPMFRFRNNPSIPRGQESALPPAGMNGSRLDALAVNDVIAIEFHPSATTVPMEYWQGEPPRCGLLLIWTVFSRWQQ